MFDAPLICILPGTLGSQNIRVNIRMWKLQIKLPNPDMV